MDSIEDRIKRNLGRQVIVEDLTGEGICFDVYMLSHRATVQPETGSLKLDIAPGIRKRSVCGIPSDEASSVEHRVGVLEKEVCVLKAMLAGR
jgi:hypothetical protein